MHTLCSKPAMLAVGVLSLTTLAGMETAYARESDEQEGYVSRKQYDQLQREVDILKAQVQWLIKNGAPPERAVKPADQRAADAATTGQEKNHSDRYAQAGANRPATGNAQAKDSSEVAEGNREKEAEEARRELDTFLRSQKVLFKPGELLLEFNLAYAEDVPAVGFAPGLAGEFGTLRFNTRSADASLLARYGVAEDLEFDLSVPYGYVEQGRHFIVGPNQARQDTLSRDWGIGDISGALRYMAWHEDDYLPNITLSLNAKSRTGDASTGLGTGFWNVGGGITLLKTIDPVVFFGSLGYTGTLERGRLDPGDQIPYSFGTGFSLNDRISFLGSVVGAAIQRNRIDGHEIPGSGLHVASAQFSSTIQLSKRLFVEPFVSFGLTADAPDFVVGLNVPYRLENRFPIPFVHD